MTKKATTRELHTPMKVKKAKTREPDTPSKVKNAKTRKPHTRLKAKKAKTDKPRNPMKATKAKTSKPRTPMKAKNAKTHDDDIASLDGALECVVCRQFWQSDISQCAMCLRPMCCNCAAADFECACGALTLTGADGS